MRPNDRDERRSSDLNIRMIEGLGMNVKVYSYLMKFMYKMGLYIEWGGFKWLTNFGSVVRGYIPRERSEVKMLTLGKGECGNGSNGISFLRLCFILILLYSFRCISSSKTIGEWEYFLWVFLYQRDNFRVFFQHVSNIFDIKSI